MADDKYTALRSALAAVQTPEPWCIGTPPPNGEQTIGTRQGRMIAIATTGIGMKEETLAYATYIAAANPKVIAALLAERDRLHAALVIARDYVAADLDYLRQAYKGYETAEQVPETERDLASIDAALAIGEGNE